MVRIRASDVGVSVAAPKPSRARAPINVSGFRANAPATEATPNTTAPNRSILRRPSRSATQPMVTSMPASTKL